MAREENAFDSRSNTPQESEELRTAEWPNIPSIPRGKHKPLDGVVYRPQFAPGLRVLQLNSPISRRAREISRKRRANGLVAGPLAGLHLVSDMMEHFRSARNGQMSL